MDLINKYFPALSETQLNRLGQLEKLYQKWNERVNVISRKDIHTLYERHVLHSLSIARYMEVLPGNKVLDIGTGGGFPGIPLAILFENSHFVLSDSIGKKIKVVQSIADSLQLANVQVLHGRAEQILIPFDFVVARAVTALDQLWAWSAPRLVGSRAKGSALYALKGSGLADEMRLFRLKFPTASLLEYRLNEWIHEDFYQEKSLYKVALN